MVAYTSAESIDLKQCFIKQVEEQVYVDRATLQELKRCFDGLHLGQVYVDRATLQELKRCFDGLHLGLFMRGHVSRNLMAMPSTFVRDLCVVSNIECSDRDVEFMARLKDIHQEVQHSVELKLKFLNSCC
ncbi:hypothetical protein Hanom_Chr05g00428311 [Helianthus anomalus]